MSTALNRLLHEIVARLNHSSEQSGQDLHGQVDGAVPLPDPDEPDEPAPADVKAPAADVKGKAPAA